MKVVRLNTFIDLTKIADQFLLKEPTPEEQKDFQSRVEAWTNDKNPMKGARPEMARRSMSATEFFKDIVGQALRQVYKSGNIGILRRTNKILGEFDITIADPAKAGIVVFEDDDFKYIRSAFKKADDWKNTGEIAKALIEIDDAFESAEEATV